MGEEIERKFEVVGDAWRGDVASSSDLRQGYLSIDKERTVRVRTKKDRATLTIKGLTVGATRAEFEYDIPKEDADQMLRDLCVEPIIEKTRHRVTVGAHTWEVDEFRGANAGLVIAEVELDSEDEELDTPDWVGKEVTDHPRFYNANLVSRPFETW